MATIMHEHELVGPLDSFRVSWGGIWGGVLVVMGVLLLLTTLGIAIGMTAAEPGATEARTVGTAAAVWTGVSLLIALFVGGLASTRLGMILDKTTGVFEGALVWVLSFLVLLYLAGSGVRLVASGVSGLFGGVTQVVGSALPSLDELSQGDVEQILARLRSPETAGTLAAATGIPEQEVRDALAQVEGRVQAVRDDPARVAAEVREGTRELLQRARDRLPGAAAQMQSEATRTAWITLAALVLSLLAAIAGSMLGRGRVARLTRPERLARTDDARSGRARS